MEAKLDALKTQFRKFAGPVMVATTFAFGGGAPTNAHAGGVLDGVVDELKTQAEQWGRSTVQKSFRGPNEDCRINRSSRSGSGDRDYNQGSLSQNCRELSYEEQMRREAYRARLEANRSHSETMRLKNEIQQRELREQYRRQQGHTHHYNGTAAKREISPNAYYQKKETCTDVKLMNGEARHVRDAEQKCTAELNRNFTINY